MERIAEIHNAIGLLRGDFTARETLRAASMVAVDILGHPNDPEIPLTMRYNSLAEGLSQIDHTSRYYKFMEEVVDNIVRVIVTDARHDHLSAAQSFVYWDEINRFEKTKVANEMMASIQAGFHAETGVIIPQIPVKIAWTKMDPQSIWSPVSKKFMAPSNLVAVDEFNYPSCPKDFATGITINPHKKVGYDDPFEIFRSLFKAYYHEFLKHVAKDIKLAQKLVHKGMEEDVNLIRDIVLDKIDIDFAVQGEKLIFVEDRLPSDFSLMLNVRVLDSLLRAAEYGEVRRLGERSFFGWHKPELSHA